MIKSPAAGTRWPGGEWGEVVGPSGLRCHTAGSAAVLLGVTDRTVRNWARERTYPDLVVDVHTGRKAQFFLVADGVETVAKSLGRWPRKATPDLPETDGSAWAELWIRQGHDLEKERAARTAAEAKVAGLQSQVDSLSARVRVLNKQKRRLTIALSEASAALASEVDTDIRED